MLTIQRSAGQMQRLLSLYIQKEECSTGIILINLFLYARWVLFAHNTPHDHSRASIDIES